MTEAVTQPAVLTEYTSKDRTCSKNTAAQQGQRNRCICHSLSPVCESHIATIYDPGQFRQDCANINQV